MSILGPGSKYHGPGGICLGMALVLTTFLHGPARIPNQLPTATRGTSRRNQRLTRARKVPKGTAEAEPEMRRKKLRRESNPYTVVGNSKAVPKICLFQSSPSNVAYSLLETYPATEPKRHHPTTMTVAKEPRFEGERKPSKAKARVMRDMQKSWEPVPTAMLRRRGREGGR